MTEQEKADNISNNWIKGWLSDKHITWRTKCYNALVKYLVTPPKTILDIGCGIALESRLFYKNFGTELWLLDGEAGSNPLATRHGGYEPTARNFEFYCSLNDIRKVLEDDNIKNFHLIDANNIQIPKDLKFDLICSWASCGVHYPISTYEGLIRKHSNENTRLIFDIRHLNSQKKESNFNVINVINIPDAPKESVIDPTRPGKVSQKMEIKFA